MSETTRSVFYLVELINIFYNVLFRIFHNLYLFKYYLFENMFFCPDFVSVDNNTTIVPYVYLTCFSDKPVYL